MRLRAHSPLHRGRESCGLRTHRPFFFLSFPPIEKRPFYGSTYSQWCVIFIFYLVGLGLCLRGLGFIKQQLDKGSRYPESRCPPLTCQDVPARGGPLLHFHPPHTHEVLLLVRIKLVFSSCLLKCPDWSAGCANYIDVCQYN